MTINRSRIIGVIAIAVSAVAVAMALVAHKGLPFRSYDYVEAAFVDVGSVRSGDDVRVGSVRVGQVDRTYYDGDQAIVVMQLPGGYDVHPDARAAVGARNALGQRFVHLDPGGEAGELEGVIPLDRTSSAVELDDVLGELDGPTRAALQTSIQELGIGSMGGADDLSAFLGAAPKLLDDLGLVAGQLTAEDAELIGLLSTSNRLASRFEGRTDELAALIPDMATSMGAMATSEGDAVDETLAISPEALRALNPALVDLEAVLEDLSATMVEVGPSLTALGNVSPDLRRLLVEARTPLSRVPGVSAQLVPAFNSLDALIVDLAPIAPDVRRTIELGEQPLVALAPYAPDIANWYINASAAIADGDGVGNWMRFVPITGLGSTSLPVPQCRNPYPAPGESATDRASVTGAC